MKTIRLFLYTLLFFAPLSLAEFSPRHYYTSAGLANLTTETITNVTVRLGETQITCDSLNNNGYCQERFGRRPFPQDDIELTWTDSTGEQNRKLELKVPATMGQGKAFRLELEIHPGGEVKWQFRSGGRTG